MALQQFDYFPAEFQPRRRDDLTPQAAEWIGWAGIWQAAFLIEDGPYAGEFACVVKLKRDGTYPGGRPYPPADAFAWVPQFDLLLPTISEADTKRIIREREEERSTLH